MFINFNKKIYPQKDIKEAVKDYKELAEFEIKPEKGYFRLKIKNINPAIKSLFRDEFANYVLGIINKK